MAALAALCTTLGHLGFTNEAALFITNDQGMNSLDEFRLLKDEEVENLCKVVRWPGGTIINPNAAQAGQPAMIPNPGLTVLLHVENNLKLACYFLCYRERTSRAVMADEIRLDWVRAYHDHKEWEENHEDIDPPEINARNGPRQLK